MQLIQLSIIGYIATFFTIIHLIPQVIKIYITNYTLSLSIYSYIILFFEAILWTIYGYFTNNMLLSFGNLCNLVFLCYILFKIINNNYIFNFQKEISVDIKKIYDLQWL